jgi:hypothetical protein
MKESVTTVDHLNSKRRNFLPIGTRFLKQHWFLEGSLVSPDCRPVKNSLIFNLEDVGYWGINTGRGKNTSCSDTLSTKKLT